MADVNPIPEGYPRVTPYLYIDGAAEAIDFYEKVLGAKERMRLPGPDGKLGHAELEMGNSVVMLADQNLNMDIRGPKEIGGTPVSLHVYVEDVDAAYAAGLDAGATSLRELENQFYGDRTGTFEDPWGHHWTVATHVEDVSADEMEKRAAEVMSG